MVSVGTPMKVHHRKILLACLGLSGFAVLGLVVVAAKAVDSPDPFFRVFRLPLIFVFHPELSIYTIAILAGALVMLVTACAKPRVWWLCIPGLYAPCLWWLFWAYVSVSIPLD